MSLISSYFFYYNILQYIYNYTMFKLYPLSLKTTTLLPLVLKMMNLKTVIKALNNKNNENKFILNILTLIIIFWS